jgi:stage II sporulation protein D
MTRRIPTFPALLAAVALLAAAFAATAPAAQAQVKFQLRGAGFGHGIGMSQWGAYGYAKQGAGHRKILSHYYRKTNLGKAKARQVRILLSVRGSEILFRGAKRACGRDLDRGRTYRAKLNGSRVRLERNNGRKMKGCGGKLVARSGGRISIVGDGTYRGRLVARPGQGGLMSINKVGLEGYLRGVVPLEVPASWPAAALRAQAIAARSYALATGRKGVGFDHYNDTRSQVYGGVPAEKGPTNRAVKRTRLRVLRHGGTVIPAFFFSSSGGRTEAIQNVWSGSSPRPYLKSVPDPYDKASPHHRWRLTYTRSQMESRLSGLVKGRLRSIRVLETGRSPRIISARIVGSNGNTRVSGDTLRSRLGLRSTWVRIKRVSG